MDKKKLTRRVALGSIAGGLAGTALVIRALKGRYNVEAPLGDYEREWDKYVKLLDVPIQSSDGPPTIVLGLRPQTGERLRVLNLTAQYGEHSYPAKYPQPPFWYTITDGRITAIAPIEDDRAALLIHTDQHVTKFPPTSGLPSYTREYPTGECVLVSRNGAVDYFDTSEGTPKRLSLDKVDISCYRLGLSSTFDYPKLEPLTKGIKWAIPKTSDYGIELNCEVVGFAEVAGRETVKIVAKESVNKPEVAIFVGQMGNARGFDKDKELKKALKKAAEEERVLLLNITTFADLKTGIVVRQEYTSTIHRPEAPRKDQISIIISQAFEC